VDLALAGIISVLLILISLIFLPFFHWARNRKKILVGLSVVFVVVLLYTVVFAFPYNTTHPKRVFIQHTLAYDPPIFVADDYTLSYTNDNNNNKVRLREEDGSLSHLRWNEGVVGKGGKGGGEGVEVKWKNSRGKRVATRLAWQKEMGKHLAELPAEDIAFISFVDPYPIPSMMKVLGEKGIIPPFNRPTISSLSLSTHTHSLFLSLLFPLSACTLSSLFLSFSLSRLLSPFTLIRSISFHYKRSNNSLFRPAHEWTGSIYIQRPREAVQRRPLLAECLSIQGIPQRLESGLPRIPIRSPVQSICNPSYYFAPRDHQRKRGYHHQVAHCEIFWPRIRNA